MKCQQTTSEALTKVFSETISRGHKLEGEILVCRLPWGIMHGPRQLIVRDNAIVRNDKRRDFCHGEVGMHEPDDRQTQ